MKLWHALPIRGGTGASGPATAQQQQQPINVKIGVLNDRSGLYADLSGEGSVLAASAQIGGAPDLTSPAKLSPMEMPRHLEIRKERPKTVVGKLSRLELRRQLDQPVAA